MQVEVFFHHDQITMRLPFLSLCVGGAASSSQAASKPNIIVLFADDLGAGDLGVYGHPTMDTPNLDQFASEGMRFTQWYSGFHVCSPSRASMMTGRLPIRNGCAGAAWTGGVFNADSVGGLALNETTMAQVAKGQGYATCAVGKYVPARAPSPALIHIHARLIVCSYRGPPWHATGGTLGSRSATSRWQGASTTTWASRTLSTWARPRGTCTPVKTARRCRCCMGTT
jgi:hypothetical protein